MARKRQKQYAWTVLRGQGLLNLRFCDLNTTALTRQTDWFYAELAEHGISFRPHYWFSEEWVSLDGIEAGTVRLCQRVPV